MDFTENLPLFLAVIAFIVLQIYLGRRQRTERTPPEIVRSLLVEITQNLKLIEASSLQGQFKKFKTGSWKRNNRRLAFLDESLRTTLSDTFRQAEDFNQQIAAAKKTKSIGYLYDINVDKLKSHLWSPKRDLRNGSRQTREGKSPL